MNFPDPRDDETFSTLTTLRQSQLVMTRMLKIFASICEKHSIQYILMYGTLLGAVRHQGFIPWDGDVDVGVKTEDIPKLKEVLMAEIPPDMFYQDKQTDPFYKLDLPKLRDRYSNYSEWARKNPKYQHHNGLQVDIFAFQLLSNGMRECPSIRLSYPHKDMFEEPASLLFEGRMMSVPTNYMKMLIARYKSIEIPPKNKQFSHEGAVDIFKPCNHPESLEWSK